MAIWITISLIWNTSSIITLWVRPTKNYSTRINALSWFTSFSSRTVRIISTSIHRNTLITLTYCSRWTISEGAEIHTSIQMTYLCRFTLIRWGAITEYWKAFTILTFESWLTFNILANRDTFAINACCCCYANNIKAFVNTFALWCTFKTLRAFITVATLFRVSYTLSFYTFESISASYWSTSINTLSL